MRLSLASRQRVDSPFSRGKEIAEDEHISKRQPRRVEWNQVQTFYEDNKVVSSIKEDVKHLFLSGNQTLRTRMDIIRSVNALKPNKRIRRYQRISLEARADLKNDNQA